MSESQDVKVSFQNPNDVMHFIVRIRPISGIWANHNFDFKFDISEDWPIDRPKIMLLTKIWHPNIDEEGNICLDIIRDRYSPVLTISQIAQGLLFLFNCPNPLSPLNEEAATQLMSSPEDFREKAEEYMEEYCQED